MGEDLRYVQMSRWSTHR